MLNRHRFFSLELAVCLLGSSWVSATGPAFHPPQPYVLENLYKEVKTACPAKDWPCFEKEIHAFTMTYGPKGAIETFTLLRNRHDIDPSVDAHHVVHHIGHHTAMAFGSNPQAFNLCPSDYNYGCLHGFFQYALSSGGSTEEAASKICEGVEGDATALSKTKFSCYHGLGHGIMMHEDHDLMKSLKVCDSLKSPTGQDGCWQGVFMENVDVAEEGQWEKGMFSKEDPLAPCDKVDAKYQHECFINHSGWLMVFYKSDIGKAAQACQKAPVPQVSACLQTLGLLTTNAAWQSSILPGADKTKFAQNAWTLCKKFPQGTVNQCVIAALDNILNSTTLDAPTVHAGASFCEAVDAGYRSDCFRQIGNDVRYLTPDYKSAHDACLSLKNSGRKQCLAALGAV